MKYKPQNLTSWAPALLLAVSAVVVSVSVSPVIGWAQEETPAPDKPKLTPSSMTAKQVLDGALEQLNSGESLSVKLNHTVLMTGHRLRAVGAYQQASGNRFRLEYRLYPIRTSRVSDKESMNLDSEPQSTQEVEPTGSLSQVSDGNVLWTYWNNAGQKQLTRRNIQEIVEAADSEPNYTGAQGLKDLGVGGLQALVAQIRTGMEFGKVMEQETKSGMFYVLNGRWTQKALNDYFGRPEGATAPLPDFVPDYVRIYINSSSMMPRRVEYLKRHPNPELKLVQPLTVLDLREFNREVSDDVFVFKKPDEDIKEEDLTTQTIEKIKRAAK